MNAVRWNRELSLDGPSLIRYGRPEEAPEVVEESGLSFVAEGVVEQYVLVGWWPFRRLEKVLAVVYRLDARPEPEVETVSTPEAD